MTRNDIRNQIEESIEHKNKVKVYFRLETRTPLYGKFVILPDGDDLRRKGMYRFVNEPVVEKFDERERDNCERSNYTRILTLDSILLVKEVVYATK